MFSEGHHILRNILSNSIYTNLEKTKKEILMRPSAETTKKGKEYLCKGRGIVTSGGQEEGMVCSFLALEVSRNNA